MWESGREEEGKKTWVRVKVCGRYGKVQEGRGRENEQGRYERVGERESGRVGERKKERKHG